MSASVDAPLSQCAPPADVTQIESLSRLCFIMEIRDARSIWDSCISQSVSQSTSQLAPPSTVYGSDGRTWLVSLLPSYAPLSLDLSCPSPKRLSLPLYNAITVVGDVQASIHASTPSSTSSHPSSTDCRPSSTRVRVASRVVPLSAWCGETQGGRVTWHDVDISGDHVRVYLPCDTPPSSTDAPPPACLLPSVFIDPDSDTMRIAIWIRPSASASHFPSSTAEPPPSSLCCPFSSRSKRWPIGYVGIQNQGSTCYMNSIVQLLFHLRPFREAVYSLSTSDPHSVVFALQKLFFELESSDDAVSTLALTKSFGWSAAQAWVQHDVQEFLAELLGKVEAKIRDAGIANVVENLFRGTTVSVIQSEQHTHSSTQDHFFHLTLPLLPPSSDYPLSGLSDYPLSGLSDYPLSAATSPSSHILASLKSLCQSEVLTDFQRELVPNAPPRIWRRTTSIVVLPPVLTLVLQRWTVQCGRVSKMNDLWRYDPHLSLEGLVADAVPATYRLFSVLVHTGQAHSGHYFSYVSPELDGTWYEFNDDTVRQVPLYQVLEGSAGGGLAGSAYMLVYVKESFIPILLNRELSPSIVRDSSSIIYRSPSSIIHRSPSTSILLSHPTALTYNIQQQKQAIEKKRWTSIIVVTDVILQGLNSSAAAITTSTSTSSPKPPPSLPLLALSATLTQTHSLKVDKHINFILNFPEMREDQQSFVVLDWSTFSQCQFIPLTQALLFQPISSPTSLITYSHLSSASNHSSSSIIHHPSSTVSILSLVSKPSPMVIYLHTCDDVCRSLSLSCQTDPPHENHPSSVIHHPSIHPSSSKRDLFFIKYYDKSIKQCVNLRSVCVHRDRTIAELMRALFPTPVRCYSLSQRLGQTHVVQQSIQASLSVADLRRWMMGTILYVDDESLECESSIIRHPSSIDQWTHIQQQLTLYDYLYYASMSGTWDAWCDDDESDDGDKHIQVTAPIRLRLPFHWSSALLTEAVAKEVARTRASNPSSCPSSNLSLYFFSNKLLLNERSASSNTYHPSSIPLSLITNDIATVAASHAASEHPLCCLATVMKQLSPSQSQSTSQAIPCLYYRHTASNGSTDVVTSSPPLSFPQSNSNPNSPSMVTVSFLTGASSVDLTVTLYEEKPTLTQLSQECVRMIHSIQSSMNHHSSSTNYHPSLVETPSSITSLISLSILSQLPTLSSHPYRLLLSSTTSAALPAPLLSKLVINDGSLLVSMFKTSFHVFMEPIPAEDQRWYALAEDAQLLSQCFSFVTAAKPEVVAAEKPKEVQSKLNFMVVKKSSQPTVQSSEAVTVDRQSISSPTPGILYSPKTIPPCIYTAITHSWSSRPLFIVIFYYETVADVIWRSLVRLGLCDNSDSTAANKRDIGGDCLSSAQLFTKSIFNFDRREVLLSRDENVFSVAGVTYSPCTSGDVCRGSGQPARWFASADTPAITHQFFSTVDTAPSVLSSLSALHGRVALSSWTFSSPLYLQSSAMSQKKIKTDCLSLKIHN